MTLLAAAVLLALAALAASPSLAVPAARGPDATSAARGAAPQCAVLSPQEAADLMQGGSWRYLDVRTAEEFAAGHPRGAAANIPLKLPAGNGTLVPNPDFLQQVEAAFPCRRTRLVVGCKAGLRSTPACALLAQAGYRRLRNMPAGFDGWVAAGLPVDSGPLQPGGAAAGWLSWE